MNEWRCDCGEDDCIECGPRKDARNKNVSVIDQLKGVRRADPKKTDDKNNKPKGKS